MDVAEQALASSSSASRRRSSSKASRKPAADDSSDEEFLVTGAEAESTDDESDLLDDEEASDSDGDGGDSPSSEDDDDDAQLELERTPRAKKARAAGAQDANGAAYTPGRKAQRSQWAALQADGFKGSLPAMGKLIKRFSKTWSEAAARYDAW